MFFFFQSETQKRVREDIQKNMDICLENPKKYAQAVQVLAMHVNSSDQKSIQKVVDTIKATIKNQDLQPIRKYQAILLLKDLMKTQNKALGKYVVKKILKRLTILAHHKNGTKEEADQERGRDIFGEVSSSQQTYSINFLNTLLTALQQWGTGWSKAPDGPYKDFHRQYNQLVMDGVKFPKKRPKQISPSPQTRNSISPAATNGAGRSSISKKPSKDEIIKQKPKPNAPVKDVKKSLSTEIIRQLTAFYDKVKESMGLFNELLTSATIQEFTLFRDIVGEIQKNADKGNELILKLQNENNPQSQMKKIESYFTFLQKIEKDLNIVSKKPEKFDIFKTKYLKLAKACLDLISQQVKKSERMEKSQPKASDISKSQEQVTPKNLVTVKSKEGEKKGQPIIKNQNRYLSATGINVLNNIPNQFGSGQNGSVQRFGSFGGINTDRHRASIPVTSPRADKQAGSDKKQPQSLPQEVQAFKPQPQKKQIEKPQQTKPKVIEKVEKPKVQPVVKPQRVQVKPQRVQVKPQENLISSQNFFKQFSVEPKNIEPQSVSNPFRDNDSFGAFGNPIAVSHNESHEADFFGKMDSSEVRTTNMQNINPRRRNAPKQQAQADIFDPKMKSQLSDGLSAFEKRENSQLSGNRLENKLNQEAGSKKSLNFDNPFDAFPDVRKSERNSQKNSNKDQNPFSSNIFQRSGVFQNDADSVNRRFETGNFGKITTDQKPRQQPQVKEAAPNPFQTSSLKSKKNPFQSTGNPFQQEDIFSKASRQSNGSKNSQKGKQNPFQVQSIQRSIANPFQSNNIHAQNPFQTSTQKSQKSNKAIDDILQMFKPPTKKEIQDLSQRQSFKNFIKQDSKKGATKPPSVSSQNVRQSIVFSVRMDKQPQPGLTFSQFQDFGNEKPNTQRQSKQNQQQQLGFSLSKFGDVNDPFQGAAELKNTQDFFAAFQNRSRSNKSKDSKSQHSQGKNAKTQNPNEGFFQALNFNQQTLFKRQSVPNDKKSVKMAYDDQKTVKSVSQKSFDFQQLQRNSQFLKASQNVPQTAKPVQFEDFAGFGKLNAESNKQLKGPIIDLNSQKELSWGDFDVSANNMQQNQQSALNDKRQGSNSFGSKLLEVQSKNDLGSNNFINKSYEKESNNNKSSRQASVNLNLQDFAPISKKGTEWNPLSLIPNLKPAQYTYMIDDKKLKTKQQELQQIKKQYDEKLKYFKQAKQKNDQVRNLLMEKANKVQEIINQKGEFIQILKKLKQNNEIKQQHILNINQRIKRVEQIKTKILQREKKLFDITKTQINQQERKVSVQRSTVNKWQLFNKSLEMHRNSTYSMTTKLTNHGLSYF